MRLELKDNFLSLVRLGIGHPAYIISYDVDWMSIEALAGKQGLLAILVDGIERLPEKQRPPKAILLEWIGSTLQSYEQRYASYEKAIGSLTSFYNRHGFRMMILKGYACSLDWPKPAHRPCGDIDIWQFGSQKAADALLTKEIGIVVDNSHHHHTVFEWKGFTVENHYDFINVHHQRLNEKLEKIFKELGADDSNAVEVYDAKVNLPSPNLHCLFLLKHTISHFAAAEITLRQVLDWAFFVEKHTKDIDWTWLLDVLEEFNMKDFFNCLNAICVEDLGFDVNIFPSVQFSPGIIERVLNDIMSPEFSGEEPKRLLPRLLFKYRRWKANEWKHDLCYAESMWSSFWRGVFNHLLKPSSI